MVFFYPVLSFLLIALNKLRWTGAFGLIASILVAYNYPMKLVMYFGNDFIAAIDVTSTQLSQPGYIGKMKRKLMDENRTVINVSSEEIEFLLVNIPPKKR